MTKLYLEEPVPRKLTIPMLTLSILLSACGASASGGAAPAVEDYITALAAKDQATLISNSCADWEDDALIELDSFALVEVTIDGMSCTESGTDGDKTLVDCQGKFQMSYGGEPQELDLSARTYEVIEQSGDWLVCGVR
ncbi:MAG: hypothetical protein Q8L87_12170 [Anaerolineales bacterium]|nr:hypothetical protein [Anaerolineales bacterium]